MSADGPTPLAEPPLARSQVVKSNSLQILLYVVLTLLLTVATVWGTRVLQGLRNAGDIQARL
jgi:hypothetical protein